MNGVSQLSQVVIPKNNILRFQNDTLNIGRTELVTICDWFQVVILHDDSLRSQFVTLSSGDAK